VDATLAHWRNPTCQGFHRTLGQEKRLAPCPFLRNDTVRSAQSPSGDPVRNRAIGDNHAAFIDFPSIEAGPDAAPLGGSRGSHDPSRRLVSRVYRCVEDSVGRREIPGGSRALASIEGRSWAASIASPLDKEVPSRRLFKGDLQICTKTFIAHLRRLAAGTKVYTLQNCASTSRAQRFALRTGRARRAIAQFCFGHGSRDRQESTPGLERPATSAGDDAGAAGTGRVRLACFRRSRIFDGGALA